MKLMFSLILGAVTVGVSTNIMFAEKEDVDMVASLEVLKPYEMQALKEEFLLDRWVETMKLEIKNYKKQQAKKEKRYLGKFTATAYDLTVASCGKTQDHPAYGITASGFNLEGHTLESARAIAVDRNVIPLGTKVRLEFSEGWEYLDGVYTAVDTGSAIKGNKVDIFFGDTGDSDTDQIVWDFGRREVKVYLAD